MLEVAPKLTPADIKRGLCETAEKLPDVAAEMQGAGILKPRDAVDWARARAQTKR
jgi:hypothetical protein